MVKKTIILALSIFSIACLLYYTTQYFLDGQLVFDKASQLNWMLSNITILVCLIIGVVNSIGLSRVRKQNIELKNILNKLIEQGNKNHFELLHKLQNSDEITLDILNEIMEKE